MKNRAAPPSFFDGASVILLEDPETYACFLRGQFIYTRDIHGRSMFPGLPPVGACLVGHADMVDRDDLGFGKRYVHNIIKNLFLGEFTGRYLRQTHTPALFDILTARCAFPTWRPQPIAPTDLDWATRFVSNDYCRPLQRCDEAYDQLNASRSFCGILNRDHFLHQEKGMDVVWIENDVCRFWMRALY